MGVDDQSCTDLSDPFQNMRTGLYLQRALHSDASIISPLDMLTLHTIGSARAIGVDDRVGSLEVGKYADFLVVDPTNPHLGPIWDPVATYVLACGLRNLAEVVIGGTTAWCRDQEQPLRTEADEQATARMIAAGAVSGFTPVR
jgi:cytosine/adenosine deaminase-related metal-dependent hydrolase